MMIYRGQEILLSNCNYNEGVAIIQTSEGVVCIPEDGATESELAIIAEIKADVEARIVEVDEVQVLEDTKLNKISELQTSCNQDILNGFQCTIKGEERTFGSNMDDQINMISQLTLFNANPLLETVIWKCKGLEGLVDSYTKEEFMQICTAFETSKRGKIAKFWSLKQSVLNSTTTEEVSSIVW